MSALLTGSPLVPRPVPFGSGSLTGSRFPPPTGNRNRSDRFPSFQGTGSPSTTPPDDQPHPRRDPMNQPETVDDDTTTDPQTSR